MKKLSTLVALLFVVLTVSGQTISRQEAMERAIQFLQSTPAQGSSRRAMTQTPLLKEVATDMGNLYVFNVDGGGFVIASGDERAVPVLGYSTTGNINWQHMPENMRYWLESYNKAIDQLAQSGIKPASGQRRAVREAIQPLVTAKWGQSPVFNDDCPMYTGQAAEGQSKRCVTGCTATSIAQVMYYHKWPQDATTAIPAYKYEVGNVQKTPKLTEEFSLPELPATTFDWNNMRDKYLGEWNYETNDYDVLPDLTDAQRMAVAKLMRYCGQMVQMSYSPTISLAFHAPAVELMPKYFNYDKGIRCAYRDNYTIDEWENLIYSELAAKRPVVYSAASDDGGHSFVCDGYDGQGLFHINWGWGGDSDNYFSLSVLNSNSYSQRVEAGMAFNQVQSALIGIQKPAGGTAVSLPELENISPLNVTLEKGVYYINLEFIYFHQDFPKADFQIELFEKQQDGQWEQFTEGSETLSMESGANKKYGFNFNQATNEADCQKYLYVRTRYKGSNGTYGEWKVMGRDICVEYRVKNGNLTLTPQPDLNQPSFDVKDWSITRGTGSIKSANEITLTIENKGGEFSGIFTLVPYFVGTDNFQTAYNTITDSNYNNEYPRYTTLSTGVYLRANSTQPVKFTFTPDKAGNYLFLLYNAADPDRELFFLMLSFPAEVTGIEEFTSDRTTGEKVYYDLQGRRVATPKKGLYIVNGRKAIK